MYGRRGVQASVDGADAIWSSHRSALRLKSDDSKLNESYDVVSRVLSPASARFG
jgi:hypothetical protein